MTMYFKSTAVVDAVRAHASYLGISDAGQDIQKFADALSEQQDPDEKIVGFHINQEKGNVVVAFRDKDHFRVCRFFMIGNKWECSQDAEGSADQTIVKLIKLQEKFA